MKGTRTGTVMLLMLGVLLIAGTPAFAQVDFTGVWNGNTNAEDGPERAAGPSLVEFLGLPINDQARQWGLAYRPGRLSLPEHQCQVHVVHYIHRGPFGARIWEERDPVTHQLIAIHEAINTYEQKRTIWMDGRPHPSPNAPHTWMGFSTGVWEGNMLTITTTHIKQGWYRRENIPSSDEATTIEHWVRNGNVWTHISVTEDPIFLAEPLIKSEDFTLNRQSELQSVLAVRVHRGRRAGARRGAALSAGREPLDGRVRGDAQPAAGSDAGRGRADVSGVPRRG